MGKGLASAALGALLQSRGYSVRLRKLDPYLNVDPGTMSPFEHGEVFVTDDGAETDLDLGHYERFTGVNSRKSDNKIFKDKSRFQPNTKFTQVSEFKHELGRCIKMLYFNTFVWKKNQNLKN